VGCAAEGQSGSWKAPKGIDKAVEIDAREAAKLAYYKAAFGSGVLAPRDWHCFGVYGSDGVRLLVSPQQIRRDEWFSAKFNGSVVEADDVDGSTSGRFEVAQVVARVFPAHKAFVQNVIELFGGASDYKFAPYPKDKLIQQTDRLVQYETPPHSEGLGSTITRIKAIDDPIDGVAMLEGKTPDLLMLRVPLPREQRDLAPAIIQELLLRQRRDAR
jgi:hypothetical protein